MGLHTQVPCKESSVDGMFQGVLASVVASCLFGGIYFLASRLAPLDGEQIYGWRMLLTLPFTTAWLLYSGQGRNAWALLQRAWTHWPVAGALLLSSALAGLQLWLFMWAPMHGHALPVSLGYFLLPLAMVLVGRWVFGERLSSCQQVATCLAAAGVGWELWRVGGMAWSTWVVLLGYPAYFILRRKLHSDSLAGHWLDVVLMLPVCVWLVLAPAGRGVASGWEVVQQTPGLLAALLLLGSSSAVALALYMEANRRLPLGLFGLLSYVEPMLLVVAALCMGERMQPGQEVMYGLLGAGVVVLAAEGWWQRQRRPEGAADAGAAA